MRLFASLAFLGLATAAQAGSIEDVKALPKGASADSITVFGCTSCPPPAPKKLAYTVPVLKKGEQKVVLKRVNGEQKIFRTDAWMGGSPVTYVSTPTKEEIAALENGNQKVVGQKGDGIDQTAKTAAVNVPPLPLLNGNAASATPVAADMAATPAEPKPLDTSGFTLRQN